MSMMKDILRPQEGFKLGSPTWKRFCEVIATQKESPGTKQDFPTPVAMAPQGTPMGSLSGHPQRMGDRGHSITLAGS